MGQSWRLRAWRAAWAGGKGVVVLECCTTGVGRCVARASSGDSGTPLHVPDPPLKALFMWLLVHVGDSGSEAVQVMPRARAGLEERAPLVSRSDGSASKRANFVLCIGISSVGERWMSTERASIEEFHGAFSPSGLCRSPRARFNSSFFALATRWAIVQTKRSYHA